MAKVVAALPPPNPRAPKKFPWDLWLDGKVWELDASDLKGTKPVHFRARVHTASKARGMKAIVRITKGNIYIQAVKREV